MENRLDGKLSWTSIESKKTKDGLFARQRGTKKWFLVLERSCTVHNLNTDKVFEVVSDRDNLSRFWDL